MNACTHCSEPLGERDPICRACGFVRQSPDFTVECGNHGSEPAVALCVVCGKPVCGDCAISSGQKHFCNERDHQRVSDEWTVIASLPSVFEGQMIHRNLEQAGIEVRLFDWQAAAMLWSVPSIGAEVRVRRGAAKEAERLLEELRVLPDAGDERKNDG